MRKLVAFLLVFTAAPAALATGGFELTEQSAQEIGMAGATTAIADTPSAIYSNPAGLGFQPGLGLQAGGNLIVARSHVDPDNLTHWHTVFEPTIYGAQRLGKHFAFGVGGFSNFAEHFEYPSDWRGRFSGYMIDLTTLTINPAMAVRIVPWLSIGGGIDIVPASLEIYRGINFGGGEGNVHIGANDTGIGGNVGLLLQLVPRHLRLGVAYRTRIDYEFTGHAAISAPPEVRSMTGGLQSARTSLVLPHNFSIATGFFFGHFTADAEIKVAIWRDLQQLQVTLQDPSAPAGTPPTVDTVLLNLHNTWAIRAGLQYGFLDHDRLRVRIGGGYDTTPVPTSTLAPLLPDTNRAVISAGVGMRWRWLSVDVGYLAAILLKTTSTNPDLIATYSTFGQVFSVSVTGRWENFLQHVHAPAYEEEGE